MFLSWCKPDGIHLCMILAMVKGKNCEAKNIKKNTFKGF